jgi:hypothetical protein
MDIAQKYLNRRLPAPLGCIIVRQYAQPTIKRRAKELEAKLGQVKRRYSWHWENAKSYTSTCHPPYPRARLKAICIFINMSVEQAISTTIVFQFLEDGRTRCWVERYAVGWWKDFSFSAETFYA